jgi:Mg/Co/Ni transporter MgtE
LSPDLKEAYKPSLAKTLAGNRAMKNESNLKLLLVSDILREDRHQNHVVVKLKCSVDEAKTQVCKDVNIPTELYYIYVVDGENKLRGTVSTHELLATNYTSIEQLNRPECHFVYETDTLTEAKRKMREVRLYDLPAISSDGEFKGSISSFDITGIKPNFQNTIQNEAIFDLLGIDVEEIAQSSFWNQCLKRSIGLCLNVLGGSLCALILWGAGKQFEQILALTLFMPVLLTITEAIAAQAVAIATANASLDKKPLREHGNGSNEGFSSQLKSLISRPISESMTGAVVGLLTGFASMAIAFVISLSFPGTGFDYRFAVTFLGTIIAGGFLAAFIGTYMPSLMNYFDPKKQFAASNPVALAVSDIATLIVYILLIWLLVTPS